MRITLIESLAGVDFCHHPGTTLEWPDAEAVRLIEAGIAKSPEYEAAETATVADDGESRVKLTRIVGKGKVERR